MRYLCVSNQEDMKKESQVIFDRNAVEFVTVAAEFCKFLEQAEGVKRSAFVDTSLKILPLLYLKASMLPECETIGDEAPETFVTEEIQVYNYIIFSFSNFVNVFVKENLNFPSFCYIIYLGGRKNE